LKLLKRAGSGHLLAIDLFSLDSTIQFESKKDDHEIALLEELNPTLTLKIIFVVIEHPWHILQIIEV